MSTDTTNHPFIRLLKIALGRHRRSSQVDNTTISWPDLCDKLSTPVRTSEYYAEYCALAKDVADSIKDVGYFVGGHFKNNRRKKANIEGRDFITLDMEFAPKRYRKKLEEGLGQYAYCVYSTHKHCPDKPRLRVLIPLSREVTIDEYEPLARKLAEHIGMDYFDDTTYQVSRVMYWPSVSRDGEYIWYSHEGEWVNPDTVLDEYDDWKNMANLPTSTREQQAPRKACKKASDPRLKPGLIGAFCRVHTIQDAIVIFLSDVYCEADAGRYTYIDGSTANGVVIYDEDTYLYSHHATDPVSGILVNAFDLVRIHFFGYQDDDIEPETPINQKPSFKAMLEFARKDKEVAKEAEQDVYIYSFLSRYIYIQDGDRVCDLHLPPNQSILKLKEFQNTTASFKQMIEPESGTPKYVPVSKLWLAHSKRKTARSSKYDPTAGHIITDNDKYGLTWINEYYAPEFEETDKTDQLTIYHEHMDYLFPVKEEREWFIDWMAFNVQYPGLRCKVTPLHISRPHGVGRGWVVELMSHLLGNWNCKKTKMDILGGESNASAYTGYLHQSLLCVVEEVKEGSKRYAISDKIRDILTEPYLDVNIKYGTNSTQAIYTNFLFMSNHPDALVISEYDRRINVFSGPDKPRENIYYTQLYAWLHTEGVTQLYWWLKRRDLSTFNHQRSMDTFARRAMIENNQNDTEILFRELLDNPPQPVMTYRQIIETLQQNAGNDNVFTTEVDTRQVRKLLQNYASRPKDIEKIWLPGGKVVRPWQLVKDKTYSRDEIKNMLIASGANKPDDFD